MTDGAAGSAEELAAVLAALRRRAAAAPTPAAAAGGVRSDQVSAALARWRSRRQQALGLTPREVRGR